MPAVTSSRNHGRRSRPPIPMISSPTSPSLPVYQSQIGPLTDYSQQLLLAASQASNLRRMQAHFRCALERLSISGAIVNERLAEAKARDEKSKKRRREEDADKDKDEDGPDGVGEFAKRTEQLTERLEAKVREVIDEEVRLRNATGALEAIGKGELGGGVECSPEGGSTSDLFRKKIEKEAENWERMNMIKRYAYNNDYKTFKRSVHEALYAYHDEAPPLPNPSMWFDDISQESGKRSCRSAAAEESDDDLAIEREKISLTCPITLLPFKQPVTSRKCPHSFEKSAILDMIRQSEDRTTQQGKRVHCARCPVCHMMLTEADLADDPVLARKVRRQYEREERVGYDDDDDDGGGGDDNDNNEKEGEEKEEHNEKAGNYDEENQKKGKRREVSVVPNTQVAGGQR
ncbi:hypothetical protein KEM54_000982 [Ascosphaera aggregata]|nr:hypothetical protein KEM54_000982 [Ascosphaera aggregata]